MSNQTILRKFQQRGIRLTNRKGKLVYRKIYECGEGVIKDADKHRVEIMRAIDDEKEKWIELYEKQTSPQLKEWIGIIIERY